MPDASRTPAHETIANREPASGRPLRPVAVATPEDVRRAVERARRAQAQWARLSWGERKARLLAFRDRLLDRAEDVIETVSRETGKPRFEARVHEVIPIADLAHYFATRAERFLRDRPVHHHLFWPYKRGYVRYEPRGVVGIVSPWNFPFTLPMGDVIMALAARNAVVVKPSEWTPHSMLIARDLLAEARIDPDLVGVVCGAGPTGAALVDEVDMVVFTGSVSTGRKIAARCGERLIPSIMELGGKDAAIVLPDADIEHAARKVVTGAFANSGQICASIERCLVHEALYERFCDAVVRITAALRQGDPSESDEIDVGAMVTPHQVEIVRRHIDDAVVKGARILTGGKVHTERGRFVEPTVLVDVTDDMLCWSEETFGPLLPIRPYGDVDEAVRMANDTIYGLNAYVFGGSVSKAEDVANRLEAGAVLVNDVLYNHGAPEAPWGGWKASGVGRVHNGKDGLRDLCEMRYVGLPRGRLEVPTTFPYTRRKEAFFERIAGLLRSPFSRFL